MVDQVEGTRGLQGPGLVSYEDSEAAFWATICEESAFPWTRTAAVADRRAQLSSFRRGLSDSTFAPFDRNAEIADSVIQPCLLWPTATQAPELQTTPLPPAPTLILSGSDDLRTPVEDAQRLAAALPRATLQIVPKAGHDVLGSYGSDCGAKSLARFFADKPVKPCGKDLAFTLPLFPLAPTSLAHVSPLPGTHGRAGRTAHAVQLTLRDFGLAFATPPIRVNERTGSISAGALRSGVYTTRFDFSTTPAVHLLLQDVVYVPGVVVNGELAISAGGTSGELSVSGGSAARGTLLALANGRLEGTLGGEPVNVPGLFGPMTERVAVSARNPRRQLTALMARIGR